MAINPMKSFKNSLTKEYTIQGKKVLFRILDGKETTDIEVKILAELGNFFNSPAATQKRQLYTLANAIVTIDGSAIKDFDDVKAEISKGKDEKEAILEEIQSWDTTFVTVLYGYYSKFYNEKDKKYEKDLSFLTA